MLNDKINNLQMIHTRLFNYSPNSKRQTLYDRINALMQTRINKNIISNIWNLLGSLTHIQFFFFFSFSNCIRGVNANFCISIDTCVQYLCAMCTCFHSSWLSYFFFLSPIFIYSNRFDLSHTHVRCLYLSSAMCASAWTKEEQI